MKKKKISGVLIYLFCCALVLLLYMNFVYTPLSKTIAQLDQRHSGIQEQISGYKLQEAQKDNLVSHIDELKSQIAKAEEAGDAVTAKNAEEDIGAACKAAGIDPKSLNLSEETEDKSKTNAQGKPLCSITADLEVTCTGAQLQTLLNYFEQESKGAYYVKSVSFKTNKDVSDASLSLLLYYFGAQETKK